MPDGSTKLEPEAEGLIQAFPKQPLTLADIHSIAISLKRIADAVSASEVQPILAAADRSANYP